MPVGLMCLMVFFKKLKYNPAAVLCIYIGGFSFLAAVFGFLRYYFNPDTNLVVLVFSALILLFLVITVKTYKLKTLYLFASTSAVTTSLRLYGYLLEASLDSSTNYLAVQRWGLLLRWGLTAVFFAVFVLILPKIRWVIDNNSIAKVWRFIWLVPITFAASNLIIIPHDFYFFQMGRISQIYITVSTVLFVMHLLLQFMLYYTAKTVTEKVKLDAQAQLLSVQASQYESLQRHIEATSKLRHDFKHTARTAAALAQKGDNEALIKLLTDYKMEVESTHKQTLFTKNSALNALICYYFENATEQKILCNWQINLPEKLGIEDIDLCTVIGNLLENAIHAAKDEEEQNRYINLKADTAENGDIYIVATNGFSGKIKKEHKKYLSTKKGGSGIGIESIKTAASRYRGYVSFYNDQNTFYADVMLKQNTL